MPALTEHQENRLRSLISLIGEGMGAGPSFATSLADRVLANDPDLDPDVMAAMRDVAASDEDLHTAAHRFIRRANDKLLEDLSADPETAGMAKGMRELRAHHDAAEAAEPPVEAAALPTPSYILSLDVDKVHLVVLKGEMIDYVDGLARVLKRAGVRAVVINVDEGDAVEVVSVTARKVDPL